MPDLSLKYQVETQTLDLAEIQAMLPGLAGDLHVGTQAGKGGRCKPAETLK